MIEERQKRKRRKKEEEKERERTIAGNKDKERVNNGPETSDEVRGIVSKCAASAGNDR